MLRFFARLERHSARVRSGALLVLFLALAAAACGDDDPAGPEPAELNGKWVGTYGSGEDSTDFDFTVFLVGDDSIGVIDGLGDTPEAGGIWRMKGDSLLAKYKYVGSVDSIWLKARVNGSNDLVSGAWGIDGTETASGRFVVTKE